MRYTVVTDPTIYQVETTMHLYIGQIVYQDDVQLKLQPDQSRVIKILKSNIKRISIVKMNTNNISYNGSLRTF